MGEQDRQTAAADIAAAKAIVDGLKELSKASVTLPSSSPPRRDPRPAVIVLDNVYYRAPHEEPVGTPHRWHHFLTSDEQPYVRKVRLDERWVKLDRGWIAQSSQLLI